MGLIIIGFTGTRRGLTPPQANAILDHMDRSRHGPLDIEAHHGCCVGADEEFNEICRGLKITIIGHPGPNGPGNCLTTTLMPCKKYLERNMDIATICAILLAAPKGENEILRSGTWATVRYARKLHKPVKLFFPDGTTRTEIPA